MHANYLRTHPASPGNSGLFEIWPQQNFFIHPQIATSRTSLGGGRRYLPYAFTEHGAIMAASVLNSDRAIEMSRLTAHDEAIASILAAIRKLMQPPKPERRGIGFTADLKRET